MWIHSLVAYQWHYSKQSVIIDMLLTCFGMIYSVQNWHSILHKPHALVGLLWCDATSMSAECVFQWAKQSNDFCSLLINAIPPSMPHQCAGYRVSIWSDLSWCETLNDLVHIEYIPQNMQMVQCRVSFCLCTGEFLLSYDLWSMQNTVIHMG